MLELYAGQTKSTCSALAVAPLQSARLIGLIQTQGLVPTKNEEGRTLSPEEMKFYSECAYGAYRAPSGPIWKRPKDLLHFSKWDASPTIATARFIRDLFVEVVRRFSKFQRYEDVIKSGRAPQGPHGILRRSI